MSVIIRNEKATTKPPILYIHGAMSNKNVWLGLSREVAKALPERRGYLIDLPGHGEAGPIGATRISAYATAVMKFMESNEIEKATLVGHSMGGAIAQEIAIEQPELVEKLALLSTGLSLPVNPLILDALNANYEFAVTMVRDFAFAPNTDKKIVDAVIKQLSETSQRVSHGDFLACDAFSAQGRFQNVNAKTVVVVGGKDTMTPPRTNQELAKALRAEYYEVEDAGHMVHIERPDAVARIFSEFLQ